MQSIVIGESAVTKSDTARNIGVIMDSNLSLENHIKQVCRTCNWQLRNLARLRPFLDKTSLERLVHAFISSHLDYCNSLFVGLPAHLLQRLQHIQNSAARIISGTGEILPYHPSIAGIALATCSTTDHFKSSSHCL